MYSTNATFSKVMGAPRVQSMPLPRGAWNTISDFLESELVVLGLLDTSTAKDTTLKEVLCDRTPLDNVARFLVRLKKRESLMRLLSRLSMEDLIDSEVLRYKMVRDALREFAKCKPYDATDSTTAYACELERFKMFNHLFRFTPSQMCKFDNPPLRERHRQLQLIYNYIGLLFVKWNMRSGVSDDDMNDYVAMVTGTTQFYGKRNQYIYRVVNELTVEESCPEELKDSLVECWRCKMSQCVFSRNR